MRGFAVAPLLLICLLGCPSAQAPGPSAQDSGAPAGSTVAAASDSSPAASNDATPSGGQDSPAANTDLIAAILAQRDSDHDGRSDLEELAIGTDPSNPTDGPDIDGDGIPNAQDSDVDGDGVPNAYDLDIDGDGLLNEFDNDMDADGIENIGDIDRDGDGVENKKDPDDNADGKPDPEEDDEPEEMCSTPEEQKTDPHCQKKPGQGDVGGIGDVPDDVLEAIQRLFDENVAEESEPDEEPMVEAAQEQIDAAKKDQKDGEVIDHERLAEMVRDFFESVTDEKLPEAERQAQEDEALDFIHRMFDQDGDGLMDVVDHDPDNNGSIDNDGDKVLDNEELIDGTNPNDSDSDKDGVSDGVEKINGTNPLDSDSDHDGLPDGVEQQLGTNPLDSDSDNDGVPDGTEVSTGTNPKNSDTDGDGVPDGADSNPTDNATH